MLRQRPIIYCAALSMDMAVAGVSFAVTRRAAELGATPGELGLLGATWIGTYALCALVTGRLSDRFGRRNVAQIGCVIAGVMTLACAFTTNIILLAILMAIFGLGISGFWPTAIAWVSEGADGSGALNTRLSRFSVAWNIGLIIGFLETGLVFKRWPHAAFYVATAVIALIIVVLSLPVRTDDSPLPKSDDSRSTIPKGRGFRKTAWLANFALSLTMSGAGSMFPKLATSLGIGADVHGSLSAVGRGSALLIFLLLPALQFWHTRLWPLWIGQFIAAGGLALIGWANAAWMFAVAFAVVGAVSGYTYQASVFFTMEEVSEKGKGGGLHEAVLGVGMALGPLLAGWVGSHFSLRSPYFFCAWLLVALIAAQMVLVFVRRRATVTA